MRERRPKTGFLKRRIETIFCKSENENVMKEQKNNRTRLVGVRFSVAEYELLQSKFQSTTSRQLSDYIRRILLNKKVTVFTRNKSLDEFMAEMILLRKEMNAIGNNFNQAVKKLNAFQDFFEIKIWLSVYDSSRKIVMRNVDEIKSKINQFSDQWSQE